MKVWLILLIGLWALLGSASATGGHETSEQTDQSAGGRAEVRQIQHRNEEDEEDSEPAGSPDSLSEFGQTQRNYLPVKVCGMLYYCLEGLQGPCQRNRKLMAHEDSVDDQPFPCSRLSTYPWRGCLPAKHLSEEMKSTLSTADHSGKCVLRNPSNPCYGYRPNYRFYEPTRSCYPITPRHWDGREVSEDVNPCEKGQLFVDIDGHNGGCGCRQRDSLMVNGTCYRALTQGPCLDGEWVEYMDKGLGECHESPCSPSQRDGLHIFWLESTYGRSGCYRTKTRGPCPEGQLFHIDDYVQQRGHCRSPYQHHRRPHFRPAGYRPIHRRPMYRRPIYRRMIYRQPRPYYERGAGLYPSDVDDFIAQSRRHTNFIASQREIGNNDFVGES